MAEYGPFAVALDANNLYWTDGDGIVNQIAKAGGTRLQLSNRDMAAALAIDAHNVYWIDGTSGNLSCVPIDGGTITQLATGPSQPVSLAVDALFIYWSNAGAVSGRGQGTLMKLAK
jgi:hypothetical protein